jgi:hypothetical protein
VLVLLRSAPSVPVFLIMAPSPPRQIAADISHILADYDKTIPTVLEIPSKDHPYDPVRAPRTPAPAIPRLTPAAMPLLPAPSIPLTRPRHDAAPGKGLHYEARFNDAWH